MNEEEAEKSAYIHGLIMAIENLNSKVEGEKYLLVIRYKDKKETILNE